MGFTGELGQEELDSFHSNGDGSFDFFCEEGVSVEGLNVRGSDLSVFPSVGFLVIESFASAEEVRCMMERMEELLEGFDCSSTNSIFSTKNQVVFPIFLSVLLSICDLSRIWSL